MTTNLKSLDLARITPGARGEYDKAGRVRSGWAAHALYSPRSTQDRPYSGDNIALLRQAAKDNSFKSEYWGTWRAFMAIGCRPQGKPAGRVWYRNRYFSLWNMDQVRIENMPLFESVAAHIAAEVESQGIDSDSTLKALKNDSDEEGYQAFLEYTERYPDTFTDKSMGTICQDLGIGPAKVKAYMMRAGREKQVSWHTQTGNGA